MIVRHYNRAGNHAAKRRLNPDAELEANLAARESKRAELEPRSNLRGIGVVTPPSKVKFRRPKHVRRNQGYYAANGAFIASEPAPWLEFSRDVARKRSTPKPHEARQQAAVAAASAPEAARIHLDHDFTSH